MNNITRDDIAEFINNEFGLTKKDCSNLVNDIIEEIIEGLNKHNIVKIHNFGTFKLRKKYLEELEKLFQVLLNKFIT